EVDGSLDGRPSVDVVARVEEVAQRRIGDLLEDAELVGRGLGEGAVIVILEPEAETRLRREGRDLAEGGDHRGPALGRAALGVAGEDADLRRAELLGHLDPLLDLGDLALAPRGGRAPEIVVDTDAGDDEAEVSGGPAQGLEIGGPGLGEMDVLKL